jgi:hypothetical protein
MSKTGIKIKIQFTKQNGRVSEFWATGPENWDRMGADARDAWVRRTANKHHSGAVKATFLERG